MDLYSEQIRYIFYFFNFKISDFVFSFLQSDDVKRYVLENAVTNMQPNLSIKDLYILLIPYPPKKELTLLIEELNVERDIIESNKKLIALYEKKIQKRIAQVWGEDE